MKKEFLFTLLIGLLLTFSSCEKKSHPYGGCIPELPSQCYKGRLELQDICGNYIIKVLEGSIDPSLILSSWQYPSTKVTYHNVFSLGNSYSFPDSIKEGDLFYFTIRDNKKDDTCVQCLAYSPTPNKTLSINVSSTPCNKNTN